MERGQGSGGGSVKGKVLGKVRATAAAKGERSALGLEPGKAAAMGPESGLDWAQEWGSVMVKGLVLVLELK